MNAYIAGIKQYYSVSTHSNSYIWLGNLLQTGKIAGYQDVWNASGRILGNAPVILNERTGNYTKFYALRQRFYFFW